jgi:hypothetical protein
MSVNDFINPNSSPKFKNKDSVKTQVRKMTRGASLLLAPPPPEGKDIDFCNSDCLSDRAGNGEFDL